jgi:hypothetical protein
MTAEDHTTFLASPSRALSDCRLPLFPLGVWLYPSVTLPLQIFEPRYLSMISERLKQGLGFGVVPIREGRDTGRVPSIYPVGVEVEVVDWYQQSNGLLGIKVRARQRFQIVETEVRGNQLLVGDIAYLPLDEQEPVLERHTGLLQLLNELKQHPHAEALTLNEPCTCQELSYQLAQLLPFDGKRKMSLMTAVDAEARLSMIAKQVFAMANV